MFYIIIIIGVFLDLITKNIAFKYLQDRVSVLGDFLFFKYTENTGIAFSIDLPFIKFFTIILIIVIFLYYFYEKKHIKTNKYLLDLSFGLILAGAIGNGYERIFNSKVIDFIGVTYFSVFNLADAFISLGALIYLYTIFINKK